jgi:putative membrane protein
MNELFGCFLKGMAMGAANVVPGVSGGTVAFVTGIYERLIEAIRSVNGRALGLLLRGRFAAFAEATDLRFLAVLGCGVVAGILTLAMVLKLLFARDATLVWAFFFGLILVSVYQVGKAVGRWHFATVAAFVCGAAVAAGIALMRPGVENAATWYLVLCGVAAMASMLVPGLSGSFVLLLMGNYQLVMIDSVNGLRTLEKEAFAVLLPVGIGAVAGVLLLSRALSWVFRRHHDFAVAMLSGFVAGSLLVIWPWKEAIVESFPAGEGAKEKVVGYEWLWPAPSGETALAVVAMIAGAAIVVLTEMRRARRGARA